MSASEAPAGRAAAVSPSDTIDVNCRALYVGGTGDVTVVMAGDTVPVTFAAVPAGSLLPFACHRVLGSTTATSIVALF